MADTKERVVQIIAGVLKLDGRRAEELRSDVATRKMPEWTSMKHVEIIVALEDEFGIEVEERAIARLNDVPKIVAYLDEHAKP